MENEEVKEAPKEEELFIPKTKHKGLKIILAILLIAGLAAGGYFLYQYKFNNPKVVVTKIIEGAKNSLNDAIDKTSGMDKYRVNGYTKLNIKTEEASPITDIIKDIEFQFNGDIDAKNKLANVSLNTKYKSDKLVDVKLYYENNDIYALLDGLYGKHIKLNAQDVMGENNPSVTMEDIKTLYNSVLDAFQKEVEKQDIKKEDAKITVDGKDVEVVNHYLELKDKEIDTFVLGIIKTLKDDKGFIEILTKLTGKDAKEQIEEFEKEAEESTGIYRINFYTDKGFFKKKLVSLRQTIAQKEETITINMDMISDEEVLVSTNDGDDTIDLRIKTSNSTLNMTLTEGSKNGSISIEINTNYEKISAVTKPDVSNSKNAQELTEEDMNEIMTNLQKNEALIKLVQEISKYTNQEV